jgi:hypothetical protein
MHHEASALAVGFAGGLALVQAECGGYHKLWRHGTACSSHVDRAAIHLQHQRAGGHLNTVNNIQTQDDVRATNQACHQRNVLSPNLLSWRVPSYSTPRLSSSTGLIWHSRAAAVSNPPHRRRPGWVVPITHSLLPLTSVVVNINPGKKVRYCHDTSRASASLLG